jgi:tetratricopeptide (TPR) repeat protein
MKILIFITLTLLCLNNYANETLFTKANNEYIAGNYAESISIYDSIILSGKVSSEILYNLGNCYYKQQNWANAIWHYEKSLKQNRYNENALYNLEITNLKIIDKIETVPLIFYKKWWKNIFNLLDTKYWQILTIICMWMLLIIELIYRIIEVKKRYLMKPFTLLTIILFYISYSSMKENYIKNEAIIFSSSVVVNSAPSKDGTNLFSLHSGTKVEVIDQIENWINIKIANGNSGWIIKSDCKSLN